MNKFILPKSEPFLTTYPKHSHMISILLSYNDCARQWLLNNFIQLTSYHSIYLDYYDFDLRNCPFIDCQRIRKSLIHNNNILPLIIESINAQSYVYIITNTKYINAYNRNIDMLHELLIYGYDPQEKLFYISDNFINGIYSNSTCTFDELTQAIDHVSAIKDEYWDPWLTKDHIVLFSCVDEKLHFEIRRVRESIGDYLDCKPTVNWGISQFAWSKEAVESRSFGIDCYRTIHDYINRILQNNNLDYNWKQSFHFMWEQKKLMLLRIKYMIDNEYFDNTEIMGKYSSIEEKAKVSLNLILKYSICKDSKILHKIADIYRSIEEKEVETLYEIIHEIS